MEQCPDEVLVKVCEKLDFQSSANLRLISKRLAAVGAEALVKRVRFHCREGSLKRLHDIAHHEVLCKHVDTVVFEGNLLAAVPCIHTYQAHYNLEHHQHERPTPPNKNSTAREKRLYERNMAKFNREIEKKYNRYVTRYNQQQQVLSTPLYDELIDPSMLQFPRLAKVVLSTVGRCKHVLSGRFLDSFTADCAMPIELDSAHTKDQLKHLLFPHGQPLTGLRSLEVHVMSHKFFTGFIPGNQICMVFQSLKVIDLAFRLEKDERANVEAEGAPHFYVGLKQGILREALSAAEDLEKLTISFDECGFFGPAVSADKILGTKVWPKLESLNIDSLSCTEDYLLAALQRQPALRDLRLGFMVLDQGGWPCATRRMQKELKLEDFMAHGVFEDSNQMYAMHLLDGDAYASDFTRISLGDALGLWITDAPNIPDEEEYHPLLDEEFADEEELREQHGPFTDDDDFSEMDCDSD